MIQTKDPQDQRATSGVAILSNNNGEREFIVTAL
jgi:hypothetical protein